MKFEKQKERMYKAALDFCQSKPLEDAAFIYGEGDMDGFATLCMGQEQVIIMTIHSIIRKLAEETDRDFIDVIQALIEIQEKYNKVVGDKDE